MILDELPDQLEAFLERARAVLDRDIAEVKTAAAAARAEQEAAAAALSQLQAQREQVQHQLDAVLANLHRAADLAGLDDAIAKDRSELENLKSKIVDATKVVEGLRKQRADAEHQLNAVVSELQALRTERAEAVTTIGSIKALLQSFA
jgi:chromosome segregation ATPase